MGQAPCGLFSCDFGFLGCIHSARSSLGRADLVLRVGCRSPGCDSQPLCDSQGAVTRLLPPPGHREGFAVFAAGAEPCEHSLRSARLRMAESGSWSSPSISRTHRDTHTHTETYSFHLQYTRGLYSSRICHSDSLPAPPASSAPVRAPAEPPCLCRGGKKREQPVPGTALWGPSRTCQAPPSLLQCSQLGAQGHQPGGFWRLQAC